MLLGSMRHSEDVHVEVGDRPDFGGADGVEKAGPFSGGRGRPESNEHARRRARRCGRSQARIRWRVADS
jgi:hypothetical protein